jgi:isopenicillin N synthase-like dioxygenase
MPDAIPTLDFGRYRSDPDGVAAALGAAFEATGFVQLVGHGVPKAVLDDAFAAAEAFFALSDATKRLVQDRRTNRGFIPMFDTALPGEKPGGHEAFSIGHPDRPSDPALLALPLHAETPWPDLPGFRPKLEACYAAMYALSGQILSAVARHLGAPPEFFAEASRHSYSNMRILHYPPAEAVAETTDIGVRAHVDEGLITLLVQDMKGGLAVQAPDGAWLPVPPNRDAMVINVGKLLRRWTNGRYQAALHKVVNTSGRERYSIPLFVHPSYHTRIDPMTLVGKAPAGPDFEPIVAGEQVYANFMARRVSWQVPA